MGDRIDRGFEVIGFADTPKPATEPELSWLDAVEANPMPFTDAKGLQLMRFNMGQIDTNNDGKADSILYYDEFYFYVYKYRQQVNEIDKKIQRVNSQVDRYRFAIGSIQQYVKQQEEAYRQLELRVLTAQEVVKGTQAQHDQGLGSTFEEFDWQDKGLREAKKTAELSEPDLPPKETIYQAKFVDIDQPQVGVQIFVDIRDLERTYEDRISTLEKGALHELNLRKARNNDYLKIAVENHNNYQKWLQAP